MSKQLIVNADDYGRAPGVSAGIRQAHLEGIVNSTTVMLNRPGVESDLRLALRDCPDLALGVHLVLTSGAPLLPPARLASVTGGGPDFPGLEEGTARAGRMDPDEVNAEWEAQIERFIAITGRPPDHLDSHHHFSYFTPQLFAAMLHLARKYRCAIRQPLAVLAGVEIEYLPPELLPGILAFVPRMLAEQRVPHPAHFTAAFYDETATVENLVDILAHLPEGVTELMCHPGYVDHAQGGSIYNSQRETELAALTDPRVRAFLSEQAIERVTFAQCGLMAPS